MAASEDASVQQLDVIIVGAGVSGVGAAYHLGDRCPNKTYAIFEGRADMGGTWDLFRYPGIRSDSDLYTFGFSFNGWTGAKVLADGASILAYIKSTAKKFGIDKNIRYNHMVTSASWDSTENMWTLNVDLPGDKTATYKCCYLLMCSGYYDYRGGYFPDFPGKERFKGQLIHPQKWPADLDYVNKQIVVIGSGATAVTIVPELAKTGAKHVTMLQRSPTYILSVPAVDPISTFLQRWLPSSVSHFINRWKNIILGHWFVYYTRYAPNTIKNFIKLGVKSVVGDKVDVEKHFSPKYKPWDQRMCFVPDNDLFLALKGSNASIVTDHIDTFTEKGIALKSGEELEADIIVSATGLNLRAFGGMTVTIDGQEVDYAGKVIYRGVLFSGMPNIGLVIGYTTFSWTLKADLAAIYFCRLINHMDKGGYKKCVPTLDAESTAMNKGNILALDSGYITRANYMLPKQGSVGPWIYNHDYFRDLWALKYAGIANKYLKVSK